MTTPKLDLGELKRYGLVGEYCVEIAPVEDGEYVRFEDMKARIEELEAYQKELWNWLHWSRLMLKPYTQTAQIQSISDVLTKHGMPLSPSTGTEEGV